MWPFLKRKETQNSEERPSVPSMAEFMARAEEEIDRQIEKDLNWYQNLPYSGAMSPAKARLFEIEKRALWRRVIVEASRGGISGLCWQTRGDEKVCPQCAKMQDEVFEMSRLDELNRVPVHLGCRCELAPVRR